MGSLHIVDSASRYCANGNWLWSDIGNYYGAGTSLVSFRDNSVDVFFNSSDSVGGPTIISKISPENEDLTVLNKVIVGPSNRDMHMDMVVLIPSEQLKVKFFAQKIFY